MLNNKLLKKKVPKKGPKNFHKNLLRLLAFSSLLFGQKMVTKKKVWLLASSSGDRPEKNLTRVEYDFLSRKMKMKNTRTKDKNGGFKEREKLK